MGGKPGPVDEAPKYCKLNQVLWEDTRYQKHFFDRKDKLMPFSSLL